LIAVCSTMPSLGPSLRPLGPSRSPANADP
jgi:hypothetical protein